MVKVLYVCSFPLRGHSGHKRATRQKLEALQEVANLRVVSSWFDNKILRSLELPLLELRAAFWVIFSRPIVVISRGSAGVLFQRVAHLAGVYTVREVHANASEELPLQGRGSLLKVVLRMNAMLSDASDRVSCMRIFNNPLLMRWFHAKHEKNSCDVSIYNGYRPESGLALSRSSAREQLGLSPTGVYLAFTGSASEWHGVEYLVALQQEFDRAGDGIKIVCGGGKIAKQLDPSGVLTNITPLDDAGCSKLIRAANMALLPVKASRVSPGSPLKLYDYIVNKAWVATQRELPGYSDEVLALGIGLATDFTDPPSARRDIIDALANLKGEPLYPEVDASWKRRMLDWLSAIDYGRKWSR